jgi:hypothetical protein
VRSSDPARQRYLCVRFVALLTASHTVDEHRRWEPARDGQPARFVKRSGQPITPHPSLVAALPHDMVLDGELWAGRGHFFSVNGLISSGSAASWERLSFAVFDAPSAMSDRTL